MMDRGIGVDTLETATSWSKIDALYVAVKDALDKAIRDTGPRDGAHGIVTCHISHSYPDGASLYFTYIFPRALDGEIAQWQAIKTAASDAIAANGGTISHHHGVGEDHLPWMAGEKGRARHRRAARGQDGARSQGRDESGKGSDRRFEPSLPAIAARSHAKCHALLPAHGEGDNVAPPFPALPSTASRSPPPRPLGFGYQSAPRPSGVCQTVQSGRSRGTSGVLAGVGRAPPSRRSSGGQPPAA